SFFFQAEDGIRDFHVTGVQTCALPIFAGGTSVWLAAAAVLVWIASLWLATPPPEDRALAQARDGVQLTPSGLHDLIEPFRLPMRSEERRVGKECSSRGSSDPSNKKRGL